MRAQFFEDVMQRLAHSSMQDINDEHLHGVMLDSDSFADCLMQGNPRFQ